MESENDVTIFYLSLSSLSEADRGTRDGPKQRGRRSFYLLYYSIHNIIRVIRERWWLRRTTRGDDDFIFSLCVHETHTSLSFALLDLPRIYVWTDFNFLLIKTISHKITLLSPCVFTRLMFRRAKNSLRGRRGCRRIRAVLLILLLFGVSSFGKLLSETAQWFWRRYAA